MSTAAERADVVLRLADAGERIDAICAAAGVQRSQIYRILAKYRPNRPRQRRRRTSDIPHRVLGMFHEHKVSPMRIAQLLGVSRAYVYRIIGPVRAASAAGAAGDATGASREVFVDN